MDDSILALAKKRILEGVEKYKGCPEKFERSVDGCLAAVYQKGFDDARDEFEDVE